MKKPQQNRTRSGRRLPYQPPSMVDYGRIVTLTQGNMCAA
jgi:hypothetical protein